MVVMMGLGAPILSSQQPGVAEPQLQSAVNGFLQRWLVERDSVAALRYFDDQTISSKKAIDFPCASGADEYSESRSRVEARSRARSFLRGLALATEGKSLRDVLFLASADHPEESRLLSDELSPLVINCPDEARYYLLSYAKTPRKPPLPPTVSEGLCCITHG